MSVDESSGWLAAGCGKTHNEGREENDEGRNAWGQACMISGGRYQTSGGIRIAAPRISLRSRWPRVVTPSQKLGRETMTCWS